LISAGAAIRLAGCQRNIRHRNAVSHHRFRGCGQDADSSGQDGENDRISDTHDRAPLGEFSGLSLQS
jgi:hypothetical protein